MPDITLLKGPIPILETERMRLRPHRLQDLDACVAMWADPYRDPPHRRQAVPGGGDLVEDDALRRPLWAPRVR